VPVPARGHHEDTAAGRGRGCGPEPVPAPGQVPAQEPAGGDALPRAGPPGREADH